MVDLGIKQCKGFVVLKTGMHEGIAYIDRIICTEFFISGMSRVLCVILFSFRYRG